MGRVRLAILAAALAVIPGCVIGLPSESSAPVGEGFFPEPPPVDPEATTNTRDRGDLEAAWSPGTYHGEVEQAMREQGDFQGWLDALNARLALPQDIPIRHEECGVQNAYYNPEAKDVTLCWEFLDFVAQTYRQLDVSEEDYRYAVGSAWLFVFIHELGHALIDAYQLPVIGREEDAADDIATLVMIDAGAGDAAVNAALFWILADQGQYSQAQFADEHSLNPQRFYAILCTVHGSDTEEYAFLVEEGILSPERAARCEYEYGRKVRSFSTLLEPWHQDASA